MRLLFELADVSAQPGDTVEIPFLVLNDSAETESYDYELEIISKRFRREWVKVYAPSRVNAHGQDSGRCEIELPGRTDVAEGSYELRLIAINRDSRLAVPADFVVIVDGDRATSCARFPDRPKLELHPDGSVTATISLLNCGPFDLNVSVRFRHKDGWEFVVDSPELTLAAGEGTLEFHLELRAPPGKSVGEKSKITVAVEADGQVLDTTTGRVERWYETARRRRRYWLRAAALIILLIIVAALMRALSVGDDGSASSGENPGGGGGGKGDILPPELALPEAVTVEATSPLGATVDFEATAKDVVDGFVPAKCDPASESTFPLGTTNVECSATDEAGNKVAASFTVDVEDTTPPILTLPKDVTEYVDAAEPAPVFYEVTATDVVDGVINVTCTDPLGSAVSSGDTFSYGTTNVECSASDDAGNTREGSFTIEVTIRSPE